MEIREIDYLMDLNESGVITYADSDATVNNVLEWLDTPMGTVYGRPEWGHDLIKFKHEPTGSAITAQNIEFSIVDKIVQDMPDIQLHSIYCEPSAEFPDLYIIRIGLLNGAVETTLN
jgi:phage baseplate assembly protein W